MDTRIPKPNGPLPRMYFVVRRVAVVAALFAAILCILLIANYIQTKSVDPLNSRAIAQIMQQLQNDPQNEALKEQIRALDLLARRAYFTHQWQLRTGGYLLFAFVLVFLIAFKYMSSFRPSLPDLEEGPPPDDTWENKLLSRRYIMVGGLGLFLLAFVLGFLSQSDLKRIGMPGARGGSGSGDYADLDEMRQNWPGFRGPEGIGIAYHQDAPTEWDGASGQNIVWKTPVPLAGYNSPIIWGTKIFLSGGDRENLVVYCFDADSGRILWEAQANDVPGTPEKRPRPTEDTGYAAPTMTTDGRRVFALFATGDAVCLDLEGKRIWARNLGVLVQFDQNIGGRLLGLQAATGNLVYDVLRDVEISWASPILVNTGSRSEIILNSNPFVMGHDPRTGQELWQMRCMQGEIAPSPAYWNGMVFVVNEYARLAAIRLGPEPEFAWEYIDDLSEVSSPLAANGLVFMPASYGTVTCLDAESGEQYWIQEYDEGFYFPGRQGIPVHRTL